ncbi:16S rRNA (cytidine(1402)-2'-O)-methyltransferase, partial [Enterococcus faecium]
PYRIAKTVATFAEVYGQERPAVICRELTKLHEEYLRGTLGELTEYLAENTLKGECCLLVSGFTGEKETIAAMPAISLKEHVQVLMEEE